LLGYRNLIRKSFTNSRVFIWLIGVPCIIIILLLLVFQVLPAFLFPIQIVLLVAYGISRKHITVKIYGMNAFKTLKLHNNSINRIANQPGSSFISFSIFLAVLALALSGAVWVLEDEQNQWIIIPVLFVGGSIYYFARLKGF